jgi:hypothetical protein
VWKTFSLHAAICLLLYLFSYSHTAIFISEKTASDSFGETVNTRRNFDGGVNSTGKAFNAYG